MNRRLKKFGAEEQYDCVSRIFPEHKADCLHSGISKPTLAFSTHDTKLCFIIREDCPEYI